MAMIVKPTGKVRICLDPRGLNNALIREHRTLPTLDSTLHKAQGAHVFSKANLCHGYWHCHLDEESSDLTTMATPFGHYKWRRLPFGLNVSAEIFGKRVQAAFKDLKNIHCITDNVLICGYGETTEAASENHDEAMMAFLDKCREMGIVLNPDKFIFKVSEMPFMGHILTDRGILPDPAKVRAIPEMPYPKDVASRSTPPMWMCELLVMFHTTPCQPGKAPPWSDRKGSRFHLESSSHWSCGKAEDSH